MSRIDVLWNTMTLSALFLTKNLHVPMYELNDTISPFKLSISLKIKWQLSSDMPCYYQHRYTYSLLDYQLNRLRRYADYLCYYICHITDKPDNYNSTKVSKYLICQHFDYETNIS